MQQHANMDKFHPLDISNSRPLLFTYPFCYEPHPACIRAAEMVQQHISSIEQWQEELNKGKMFGVLIVENSNGDTGFLAAFSGQLANSNNHPFFVPAVYDILQPDGYFKTQEQQISAINKQVDELLSSDKRISLIKMLDEKKAEATEGINAYKEEMMEAKKRRDLLRSTQPDNCNHEQLERESQFMKAELRRLKKRFAEETDAIEQQLALIEKQIVSLKQLRKQQSDALQRWIFDQYAMLNARGERRTLTDIFANTTAGIPPSGAGECCAPKLLQYAYEHAMHPIAMAEFWWGESPVGEIRHHRHFYPSCSSKCKPILCHMLQGLSVEPDPMLRNWNGEIQTIYEDEWLAVVSKPAGLLTTPGKINMPSLWSIMSERWPQTTGPIIVHRLDMATSGLLVLAKTKDVHQQLQQQFEQRTVKKRYRALLNGIPREKEGEISLPLIADLNDRPRQKVDFENGKEAHTLYKVVEVKDGQALVLLYPITGRTHQLRVHCAHPDGLGIPIVGDELYGKRDLRLFLHAEYIEFEHPITCQRVSYEHQLDLFKDTL